MSPAAADRVEATRATGGFAPVGARKQQALRAVWSLPTKGSSRHDSETTTSDAVSTCDCLPEDVSHSLSKKTCARFRSRSHMQRCRCRCRSRSHSRPSCLSTCSHKPHDVYRQPSSRDSSRGTSSTCALQYTLAKSRPLEQYANPSATSLAEPFTWPK